MTSGDCAAWLQAIGSIAAVVAAFMVSSRQFRDAATLQTKAADAERRRKYQALTGLVDAALEEFKEILDALNGPGAVEFFEEYSAAEIMDEFYQAFRQISPLDMPSGTAVRALVKLRDLLKASAWSANSAIQNVAEPEEYSRYIEAMQQNLADVDNEGQRLRAELART